MFLEVSYACIEDAGYTPAELREHGSVGVFVGVMNGNYPTGARYWSIANRVSFALGLQGPSVAIDTACSSSLTALHFAVESLISGTSTCAIVGGVNLIVDPVHYVRLSEVGMLSASDKCKSFGEDADGFVDGEGVGALLLKPLQKAEVDGDHIYGVIKATAINHGGQTNGYTVPNPQAQANVVEQALQRGGIDPRTISYVEAHGTGTVLGDPIEIAGLTRAFVASGGTQDNGAPVRMPVAQGSQATGWCAIGSVKSNIGHAEGAAGIAGVTKVLLQMRYGQLVPSLHAEVLNPHIDFSATPFVVQQELTEWKRPLLLEGGGDRVGARHDPYSPCSFPRRAGISSFGAGGSNAHVILEEYVSSSRRGVPLWSPTEAPPRPALIVLSARTQEQLQERVQQLLAWIQERACAEVPAGGGELSQEPCTAPSHRLLDNLAYTLQVGREAMQERLALLVSSLQELEEQLHKYVEGTHERFEWYQGQVKRNDVISIFAADEDGKKAIAAWMSKEKYEKLLELWVKGLTIDWKHLYTVGAGTSPTLPQRISLPTYPFARERYWFSSPSVGGLDGQRDRPVAQQGTQATVPIQATISSFSTLHPLVQRNISDLFKQRFSSTFDGDEFFIADHVIKGQRIMPGVAYLEMARAAIAQATGSTTQEEGHILPVGPAHRLRHVVWARPLVCDSAHPVTVHITLSPQESGTISFLISREEMEEEIYCQGIAELHAENTVRSIASQSLDLPALQTRCQHQISASECYQRYRELFISYGPAQQGIEELLVGDGEILARLRLPAVVAQTRTDFVLHPSVLDAALQACIGLQMGSHKQQEMHSSTTSVPFALRIG